MDDENKPTKVVTLRPVVTEAGSVPAGSRAGSYADEAAPSPDPHAANFALMAGFKDIEAMVNSREWLQKAIEAKGAKVLGSGLGGGEVDIDFILDGCRFNVALRPL